MVMIEPHLVILGVKRNQQVTVIAFHMTTLANPNTEAAEPLNWFYQHSSPLEVRMIQTNAIIFIVQVGVKS